jgi:transposase
VSARDRRLATVERASSAVADAGGVVQRESAGARILGRAADRPGSGFRQVLRRGELREDAARPGGEQIAEDGVVLGQHHVELRDELSLVVLAVGHEPGAQPRELAQALDLLVGHVTGLGPSDAELLQTIPGIGPQTAATLIGELGALTRFTDGALVAYVGFYPVINESGDCAATPRLSPVGPRLARHSLYLAAVNAVRRSGEWRTIYLRKKAQGKTAKQALVVVAVKLPHALYAMLKHRQPYNPSRLLVAPATIGS